MRDKNWRDFSKRRSVEYHVPKRGKGLGRSPKLWAYGYSDLARLLGVTEGALRARVARGWDPSDLGRVCAAWACRERP